MRKLLALLVVLAVGSFTLGIATAQEPITLTYWNINTPTFGGPQVDAFIAAFNEANPGIMVESRPVDGYPSLIQQIEAGIAAGTPPDVVQIGYPFIDYVANNLPYVPVDTLISQFGGDTVFEGIPQNIVDIPLVNGQRVGLSYSISNPVVYYNADLFTEAGLDPDNPPQTWAEWRDAAMTVREALNKPLLNWGYNQDNWTVQGLINANGGDMLVCEDGQVRAGFASAEAIEGVQFWADLVSDGYGIAGPFADANTAFLSAEAGTSISSIAARANFQNQATFDLRATGYPAFGDKPVRVPAGGNILVVFSADATRQEAAWQFTQYLFSAQSLSEWTMGTGYLPLNPALVEAEPLLSFVADNPIQQVGNAQIANVVRWASFPGPDGLRAGQTLFEAVQSILGGQQTAEAALAAAAETVNGLIEGQTCTP